MPISALVRVSSRFRMFSSSNIVVFLLFSLLASSSLAEQAWPLPEEVSASLLHEIPVLHTAFVQIGEELHYLNHPIRADNVNHLPVFDINADGTGKLRSNQKSRGVDEKSTFNVLKMAGKGKLPLEMDPSMMDFGMNSVGTAQKRKIYIRNMRNEPIFLDAIVVNSIEFQASYFEQYRLEPHGVTTVEVVFLPREVGKRSTTMNFYTSVGVFTYKVQGNCVSNPYRLSPFAGYRLPMNSSISKPITIFNPHPYTMRITEIGTSGGNAHVELAHRVDANLAGEPPQYWHIRPFQSKHVASVVLVGATSENTTVFVRIASELDVSADQRVSLADIYLTVPLEVLKQRGVYATDDLLDFGLIRHGVKSEAKIFSVAQYQIGGRLEFETLYVEKGDHTAIYMEFAAHPPIVVYPAGKGSVTLGPKADLVKVYLEGNRVQMQPNQQMKHISGHIIAVSRGGNYNVSIPFRADVFRGDLVSLGNDLSIQEDLRPPHQRVIRLENRLPFDVAVWNISMDATLVGHFSARLVDRTVLLKSGHSASTFVLKYNKKVSSGLENATIYVHTNVSTFTLALSTYTGKMAVELTSVDKNSFDFGFVERNDTRTIRFVVWNHNQAEMRLKNLAVPDRSAYRLYEVGVKSTGNFSDVRNDERLEYVVPTDVDIPPMRGLIFDLELKVPGDGVVRNGDVLFETDFESRLFAVTYRVSSGSLQSIPEEISFGQTFPSKLVYRTLQVFNSFDEDMTVTRLTTLNEDPRFFFEGFDPQNPPVLRSGRLTNLGRVMFSPSAPCEHEYCYLGMPLSSTDGAWFTHGLGLPSNLPEIDSYLYKQLRRRYDALVNSGKHHVNTTIILDTDKAKNIKIKTSAELVWPRLLTRNSIHFPLTALGNFTIVNLTLSNPTSIPVAIQVIPLVIYPDAESLVELMRPHLATDLTEHVEMNETLMFSLRDTELFTLKPDSPVPKLREAFEYHLNHDMPRYNNEINIPRFTLSMILKAHTKVRLRLGFLPSDYTLRSSLLLIRNNLTALEPVVMYGKGARIGVKVEGAEARSRPLLFEIRHDHLTDCNNPKRLMHKLHSTLTVRRPFQVINSGEVQFMVTNMSINGVPCENRGFRILNCYPFRLQPNETYALDIAYTPDFLTTTNEADLQLYMHMNGSAWLFPLAATVPPDMLAKCHQALPRPPFENIMYYSCVTALIFCLVCVLACAYLEGDRAIACAIRQQFAVPRHVFDLNNLKPSTSSSSSGGGGSTGASASEKTDKKAEKDKKWDPPRAPSTLRASSDAWLISRCLVNLANWVVQCVHLVWRWSLFYRKDKPIVVEKAARRNKTTPTPTTTPTTTTTTPVAAPNYDFADDIVEEMCEMFYPGQPIGFVPREMRDLFYRIAAGKVENGGHQEAENMLLAGLHVSQATVPQKNRAAQKKGKKEAKKPVPPPPPQKQQQQQNNNVNLKPEMVAPKATPSPKTSASNKSSRKSSAATQKKAEVPKVVVPSPPQKAASPTPTAPSPQRPPSPPPIVRPSTPPRPKPTATPKPTPTPIQPPPAPPPAPVDPMATTPDLFYRQFLASMGMPMEAGVWDSPAAQAAMPFMNLWNYGGVLSTRQMEELIRQASQGTTLPMTTATSTSSERTPSERQWSGGRLEDDEDAPDWADEDVNADDAEADFSAMAAASKDIFHDEHEAEEEGDLSELRRRRSPSAASSTLSRRLENSPQKLGNRRLTVGSEKKDFSRTPGAPRYETPFSGHSIWTDTQTSTTDTNTTDILNPWATSSGSSRSAENDPLSLSHLGINLSETPAHGPLFGDTMFSGPEFNLWSSSSLFHPPPPPPPQPDEDVDEQETHRKTN